MADQDEGFWNSSRAGQTKFNMFADEVSVDSARSYAHKFLSTVDEKDDDEINWDGTPSKTLMISQKSARYHPPQTDASTKPNSTAATMHTALNQMSGTPSTTFHIRSGSGIGDSSVRFKPASVKNSITSHQPSMSEVLDSMDTLPNIADQAKIETHIDSLKKKLKETEDEKWAKVPVSETLKSMISGERYSLEMYRSKEDKLALLDKSIQLHDGNAILAAILFLKTTVKAQIFNTELIQRQEAVSHYISYLKQRKKLQELEDMLTYLGRTEEAAMLKYKQATSTNDAAVKMIQLKNCYTSHFRGYSSLTHDASLIQQQIDLLERQKPLDEEDNRLTDEKRHVLLRDYPRKANVINQPLITTLYYCCFYHYDLPENSRVSPQALKKHFQLTDKQFLLIALRARSKLKRWREIEDLLTAKGWFGTTKMKSPIGFDKVSEIIHKEGATQDIIEKYLNLVDDVDRRLVLARKMKCNKVIVNTLVTLRDRSQLENYMRTLTPHTIEYYYARDALNNSATKWKT